MTALTFLAGLVALLIIPGPTNALLLAAGATRRAVRPGPALAAVAGYLVSVSTFALVAAPLVSAQPNLQMALRGIAVILLLHLALRLWQSSATPEPATQAGSLTGAIFLATLLNPKALIIAFGLLPASWNTSLERIFVHLALLAGAVLAVSSLWLWGGARVALLVDQRLANRGSALVLGGFGAAVAASLIAG